MAGMTDPSHARARGVAGALTDLTDQTAALVRREIDAARQETVDKLKLGAPAAGLLGLGGLLAAMAGASAYRWSVRLLELHLSPRTAAFVAMSGYGAAAGLVTAAGVRALQAAPNPLPTETAQETGSLVADVAHHTDVG
jgi:hypothetical protein